MGCEICRRGSCTRSFHSFDEQERFDARQNMSDDVDELREELQATIEERDLLRKDVKSNEVNLLASSNIIGRLREQRDHLREALKEMEAMYTHAWDRVEGGLLMMPDSVARFDSACERARAALAAAGGE